MEKSIKICSPASVSNLGCGFDILGFALNEPQDEMLVSINNSGKIKIHNRNKNNYIPDDPTKNVAGVALQAMLNKLKSKQGFDIEINKQIKPGSGIGSSAASASGIVVAANELLNKPFSGMELIDFALAGEVLSSGSEHADNVAPSLLGGITIIRGYNPVDIIQIDPPDELFCVLVHPQIEIKTSKSRNILKPNVPLKDAVKQWGNVAGLVTGLIRKDFDLISRSLEDHIIESQRSSLIPGYNNLKLAAMNAGALGCNISGSGPSVFALTKGKDSAAKVMHAMKIQYAKEKIDFNIFISGINTEGVKILNK